MNGHMIFNTTYKLGATLQGLTQEEIYNTPEYYALSREEIFADPKCPEHLKRVLNDLEWRGRPSVVQVRPQDFRRERPHVLGLGWHVDVNTRLVNGRMHLAKNLDEFTSQVVSFGDVVETEFVKQPFRVNTNEVDPFDHSRFAGHVGRLVDHHGLETIRTAPNQVAMYTSRDVHRVAPNFRLGSMRVIIVTFECDEALEGGAGERRPSIRERGG